MHQTNITVKYVNQPDKKPDYGSVKDAEGKYWSVPKNLLQVFAENTEYAIGYTTFAGKDGRDYHTIKEAKPTTAAKPANGNGHEQTRSRSNPADSEQIFCTALIKEFIHAGQIQCTTTDVVTAVNTLRDAYRQTFGRV